ncbi:hypothetical protein O181_034970 [Austropuccinia psidii MF-1]|uniref:Delta(24(24(1)))-sterol reductase n=1 Tax=Austropuccinia psidii MF-1 TaxID=1389203 RepID=A0A9Q3D3Y3_9BASI|nr:hypothetical protein [Austropuccinia psidii MF-1]
MSTQPLLNPSSSVTHPQSSRPLTHVDKSNLRFSNQPLVIGQFNPEADRHERYEFGGPWGVFGLMILFPCMMYYFFICLWCYDGKLSRPHSFQPAEIFAWASEFWGLIKSHTRPTWHATVLYVGFLLFQLFLAAFMPGVRQVGLPIPSLNGAKLEYYCNALASWYVTLATVFILHSTGVVPLGQVFDQLGHLMTIATLCGSAISMFYYIVPVSQKKCVRMSGNPIYDFFMGASLNPRIGHIDVKLFAEVRIPWILLFIIAVSGSVKQFEKLGYVTPNSAFMILATGLYVNACAKGEECIPLTWDMAYEKWGWMLCFWNFSGVAFTYCHSVIYITTQPPSRYAFPTWGVIALYVTYLIAYYFFDTSGSQKARFKIQQNTGLLYRPYAFPQLPYGTLENPKTIDLEDGKKLLVDGWWAWCRKPSYTADFVQTICWAACSGSGSFVPYFYPTFFLIMILHRNGRDFKRCSQKYGKGWEEYCRLVPYKYIPGIY